MPSNVRSDVIECGAWNSCARVDGAGSMEKKIHHLQYLAIRAMRACGARLADEAIAAAEVGELLITDDYGLGEFLITAGYGFGELLITDDRCAPG